MVTSKPVAALLFSKNNFLSTGLKEVQIGQTSKISPEGTPAEDQMIAGATNGACSLAPAPTNYRAHARLSSKGHVWVSR